jgi:hypothetical protein
MKRLLTIAALFIWYFQALPSGEMIIPGLAYPVAAWPDVSTLRPTGHGFYGGDTKADCEQKRSDYLDAFRDDYPRGMPDDAIAEHCADMPAFDPDPTQPEFNPD